ncbi:hypothetical protein WJX81_001074 [Elliptochloris bilobata]|uniref:Cytochrome b-c1 complex subunit 7 n=1 Tax=Elliptochloris bilobata TaxID=381761 RepID=A0AAW1RNM2_9CHLO
MAGRAIIKLLDPALTWMARRYQAAVGENLRRHGLRYEDLYDPLLNQDVEEALKRLPQEEVDARNQRLKRASDCSLKKAYLPKDLQEVQTPYKSYLGDALKRVVAENEEKARLGTGKTYDRSIP